MGEREGKKVRDGRDQRKTPHNKFLVTALLQITSQSDFERISGQGRHLSLSLIMLLSVAVVS